MVRDEHERADQGKSNRSKDPVWQLVPVDCLNPMKVLYADKLPGPENVDFVGLDNADVVEADREVQQ